MKKTLTTLLSATVIVLAMSSVESLAGTKKNDPNKKEVEKLLKEIGGEHYVERMKISSLCSMKFDGADGERRLLPRL